MTASIYASNQPLFRGGSSSPYASESLAYFAAMSVQPDSTRKGLIDALIKGLKTDGIYAVSDLITLPSAHDAQAGLVNIVNPAQVMTKTGTMTFTTDRGYQGDGSTGYLSTVTNADGWTHLSLNNITIGVYVNSMAAGISNMIGQVTGAMLRIAPFTGTVLSARAGSSSAITATVADGLGLSTIVRSDANNVALYRGASSVATGAANAATSIASEPILVNRGAATFHPGRAAAVLIGGALTPTQVAALNTRLSTYLTAIGAN